MTTISASMIVKNESSCLAKALESIKGVDEIIICDTGSTDNTIEIAKRYTNKVFTDYKWNDHFAEARNHSLSKCTGDWVLIIDADETFEAGAIDKIKTLLNSSEINGHDTVMFDTRSARYLDTSHQSIRLFRRIPEIYWKGAAHNCLTKTGGYKSNITLYYGYSDAHRADPDRTLRILLRAVSENPKLPRETFYLAREFWYRKKYNMAIQYYESYLAIAWWGSEIADAQIMMAKCYRSLGNLKLARKWCMEAINTNNDFKEAFLMMSEMTGPKNSKRWKKFAELATNEDVIFVRVPQVPRKEKDANYYDAAFAQNPDMSRYEYIYRKIGNIVGEKSVLDIGCGKAALSHWVKNYSGFDFAKKTIKQAQEAAINVWVGSLLEAANYKDADYYCLIEVLEHIDDDIPALNNIQSGKQVIVIVPSFDDPAHVRVFSNAVEFKERYSDVLDINHISYFNWIDKKWVESSFPTTPFILFAECTKK